MKKTMSFLVAILLLVSFGSVSFASMDNPDDVGDVVSESDDARVIITPFYTYTSNVSDSLTFNGEKAICSGSIMPTGTYSASVTVTLYKKNGSSWTYVNSWSDSATGGNEAYASGSSTVGSGTYKVTASGNVGGGKEYPSKSVTKTK